MEAVQAGRGNSQDAQRIIVSKIVLDCERDLFKVLKLLDGFRFHSDLVESLSEQRNITVGVTHDFAEFVELNTLQLFWL